MKLIFLFLLPVLTSFSFSEAWADSPPGGFVENPGLLAALVSVAPLDRAFGHQAKLFSDAYQSLHAQNGGGSGEPMLFKVSPESKSSVGYDFEGRLEDMIVIPPNCQGYVLSVQGSYWGPDNHRTYKVQQVTTQFTSYSQCL